MNAVSANAKSFARRADRLAARRHPLLVGGLETFCRIRLLRPGIIRLIAWLEGGQMWSETYRQLLRRYYSVSVGPYSYGECLWPRWLPPGTSVGNYCSFASNIRVFRRNHPADRISQHPFFFNAAAGLLDRDTIPTSKDNPLSIGHDVWIGQNVVVAPGCRRIGDSAIIASGAVVSADVPDFAIVGGVPAKLLRWRLPEDQREEWRRSAWWTRPVSELARFLPAFLGKFPAGEMPCFPAPAARAAENEPIIDDHDEDRLSRSAY